MAPKAAGEVALSRSDRGTSGTMTLTPSRDRPGRPVMVADQQFPGGLDQLPPVRDLGRRHRGEHGQRVAVQVAVGGLEQHLPGVPVGHRPDQRGSAPVRHRATRPVVWHEGGARHVDVLADPQALAIAAEPDPIRPGRPPPGSQGREASTRPSVTGTSISNRMPARRPPRRRRRPGSRSRAATRCPGRPGSRAPSSRCAAGRAAGPRRRDRLPAPPRAAGSPRGRRRAGARRWIDLVGGLGHDVQQHQVLD